MNDEHAPGPPVIRLDRPLTVMVTPWVDEVVERHGFDPRSTYVDSYWLPVLGPSTVLLLRRIADELDAAADPAAGVHVDVVALGRSLGLGAGTGRHAPLWRSLDRAVQFGLARRTGDGLAVRRRVPPLPRRLLAKVPDAVAADHDRWTRRDGPADDLRFACRVAWLLLEEGRPRDVVERTLVSMGFEPATTTDAVDWALLELQAADLSAS